MTQSFSCPNCSAPLDLDGDGSATIKCPYCNTSVIIPAELRLRKLDDPAPLEIGNTYNSRSDIDLTGILLSIREKAVVGDDIEAIRILRSTFVIGLKDAKDLVAAIQRGKRST